MRIAPASSNIFDAVSGKPVLSLLRPGKRPSGEEVAKVLRHVIRRIRKHWPNVQILVRGDSHYCSEPALALLEAMRCDYILGFAINSKLLEIAAPWRKQCEERRSWMKPTVRRFHQLPYKAREWSRSRKLVARVESTDLGSDARFIVTNLQGRGKTLYEKVFCARGAVENLIKDMKRFTRSDKTACSRWEANQFRLFLHMGAYWLLHALGARRPSGRAGGEPPSLREDRRARRGAQRQDQTCVPGQLPSSRHARGDDRCNHYARPMIDAASAAEPFSSTANAFPSSLNPQPSTRPIDRVRDAR
jgi:hypothetical protein